MEQRISNFHRRLISCLLLILNFKTICFAEESIAFSTDFKSSTWFPFKLTGRSHKGFEAISPSGFKICDVEKIGQPESLLVSRFIQPQDSVEHIMLEIQFNLDDSKFENLKVGVVQTDQPIPFDQYSDASFNKIKGHFGSDWLPLADYLELEITKGKSGFHIAFLDSGACLTLQSMQIKYLFCPDLKANLTLFERTTVFVKSVQGRCVANAQSENLPDNNCKSSGDWRKTKPDGDCQCDPGFEPDLSFQECQKCRQDYYKTKRGNERCKTCPANSERLPYIYNRPDSIAVKCDCLANYFRTDDEPVDAPCTTVPSKPSDLRVEVKYTSFLLSWKRPTSSGGRPDLFFEVKICLSGKPCNPIILNGDVDSYSASGFLPQQTYAIKVCAKNGVSDKMRSDIVERKSCEIYSESTGNELRVRNLALVPEQETIAIQWSQPDVSIAYPDHLSYAITVFLDGHVFSHVTTSNYRAAFSGLTSGQYTFSVVARYDGLSGPAVNLTQLIQGLDNEAQQMSLFSTPDPGVLLMIGVVVIVLLILITIFISAVCILRKKHAEWEKALPNRAFMEYESSKSHPTGYLGYGSTMPYDFAAVPVGQTFIDPHYYNLEEMLMEYTLQVEPSTIQVDAPTEAIMLGSGFFGSPGMYTSPEHFPSKHPVCVKMCKQKEPEQFKELFYMESVILGQFNHPNVLQLHGVSLKSEPMMMITENTTGSMLDYLSLILAHQSAMGAGKMMDNFCVPPGQIVHQMRGVACGMQYLSELGYVHKVLCCKNILVSENEVCKITGFDQRVLLDQEQHIFGETGVSAEILPWSPPEAYNLRKFSAQSDSWSFGVALWEVLSFPSEQPRPYFNRSNSEIMRMVDGGFRLPAPRNCPVVIYDLMKACWDLDRNTRPDFAIIQEQLHHVMRRQHLLQDTVSSIKSSCSLGVSGMNNLSLQGSPMGGTGSASSKNLSVNTCNYYILPTTSPSTPLSTADWLTSLKMSQYSDLFFKHNILTTEDVVMSVDATVLEQIGVTSSKHRKKILEAVYKLKRSTDSINRQQGNMNKPLNAEAPPNNGSFSLQTSVFSEI